MLAVYTEEAAGLIPGSVLGKTKDLTTKEGIEATVEIYRDFLLGS
jgi:hypothetical protein